MVHKIWYLVSKTSSRSCITNRDNLVRIYLNYQDFALRERIQIPLSEITKRSIHDAVHKTAKKMFWRLHISLFVTTYTAVDMARTIAGRSRVILHSYSFRNEVLPLYECLHYNHRK